jgi:hypothetical protein
MSKLRYKGPAKPIPTVWEAMSDGCLALCFVGLFAAFVFIVFVMGW